MPPFKRLSASVLAKFGGPGRALYETALSKRLAKGPYQVRQPRFIRNPRGKIVLAKRSQASREAYADFRDIRDTLQENQYKKGMYRNTRPAKGKKPKGGVLAY